jgi:gas vesicle protein
MHQREEDSYLTASLISFLAGSIIGAGIALLFAPQSGEYTRREMREKAERTIIKMHRMEDELKHTVGDLMQSIRRTASQLLDEGKDLADIKKREILEAIAAGKRALEEERCKLENANQKA